MPMRGADKHLKRLRRLSGPTMERNVGKALFAGGERVQVEAQLSITRGAVSGRNHVASAPGQPPNQDTGGLSGNIETVQIEPLRVQVQSKAEYAAPLEFGTSKMEARPYMRPARDAKRQEVEDLIARAVNSTSRGR